MAGYESSLLELGDLSSRGSNKRSPRAPSKMVKKGKKVRSISMGNINAGKTRYGQEIMEQDQDDLFDQPAEQGIRDTTSRAGIRDTKEGKSGKSPAKSKEGISDEKISVPGAPTSPPSKTVESSADERFDTFLTRAVCAVCLVLSVKCTCYMLLFCKDIHYLGCRMGGGGCINPNYAMKDVTTDYIFNN